MGGSDDDAPSDTDLGAALGEARPSDDDTAVRLVRARVAARLFQRPAAGVAIDRFELTERIGRGAMGDVFAARDPRLDRRIALKLVAGADAGARAALLEEARAAARLSHPAVVTVHDAGEHDGGVWVAMELVDGETLRTWAPGKPRDDVLAVARQIARGLAAAHRAGCIHRDVKPDNILVTDEPDGPRARLADFGLALVSAAAAAAGRAGSPAYMPPEQAAGDGATAASDQYAFCCTMWEAFTGARPDGGRTPPRAVPGWIVRVLARGLRSEPSTRFPSMDALAAALDRRPRRRLLVATGATGLIGAGALAAMLLGRAPAAADVCAAAGDELTAIWNPTRRGAIETAVGASPGYGPTSARTAAGAIDAWAEAWRAGRRTLCRDARTGALSAERQDLRAACLERQRDHAAATIDALASGASNARAVELAARLPLPDECAADRVPRQPVAPAVSAASRDLLARADRAMTELDLGRPDAAGEALGDAVEAADRLGHPPTRAATLMAAGLLAMRRGQYDDAVARLEAAVNAGIAGEEPRIIARAATTLIFAISNGQRRPDQALRWIETADAALSAAGDDPRDRAKLRDHVGTLHMIAGRRDQARAAHLEALALLDRASGAEVDRVRVLGNVALTDLRGERYAEAIATLDQAAALAERLYGAGHPSIGSILSNRGIAHAELGEHDAALADYARALSIKEASLGPAHPELASTLTNIGEVLGNTGRAREALVPLERAVAIRTTALGATHPTLLNPLINLAFAHVELGDGAAARAAAARALPLADGDPATEGLILALAAWAELVAGEVASARKLVDRADVHAAVMDPQDRAYLDYVAVRAATPAARSKLTARARSARDLFVVDTRAVASSRRLAAELETWLAQR